MQAVRIPAATPRSDAVGPAGSMLIGGGTWSPDDHAAAQLLDALQAQPPFETRCAWLSPNLAIGGFIGTPENMCKLSDHGVTHVLNLQAEFDDQALVGSTCIRVIWVPLRNDGPLPPEALSAALDACLPILDAPEHRLFVHCLAGQRRAPWFCYALLRATGLSAGEAVGRLALAEPRATLAAGELAAAESLLASRYRGAACGS